jgi:hypothetical protein
MTPLFKFVLGEGFHTVRTVRVRSRSLREN